MLISDFTLSLTLTNSVLLFLAKLTHMAPDMGALLRVPPRPVPDVRAHTRPRDQALGLSPHRAVGPPGQPLRPRIAERPPDDVGRSRHGAAHD